MDKLAWVERDVGLHKVNHPRVVACHRPVAQRGAGNPAGLADPPLEDKWAAAAEAKGLKNAKAVLAEFRSEIAKVK